MNVPATFNHDVARALVAAIEMADAFEAWQRLRVNSSRDQLKHAIGVH